MKFVASGQSSYTQGADLATAQNELAIRYFNGTGGAVKNLQSAAYWFEKSANNGNKYAQYNLAWRYYQGEGVSKNYSKALYWFEKAGKQNYHKASLKAGKMLFYGEGTDVNYTKAIPYFKDAAFGDIPEGKYYYALCFAFGYGTEKDATKAILWATRAIEDEYYTSYWTLGRMYSSEEGAIKDYEKAEYYFSLGAKHNISDCANDLGVGYQNGTFVEKDIYKALEYYTLAASLGNRYGKSNAALLYLNKDYPFYSIEKAEMMYKELIKDGYKEYESNLIDIYESTNNSVELFKIYKLRAGEGNTRAMNTLAYMYAKGEGTPKNLEKAIEIIDIAIIADPNNLNYLDSKGEFYLMGGQIKKAEKIWQKILKKDPVFYIKDDGYYSHSSLNKYFTN